MVCRCACQCLREPIQQTQLAMAILTVRDKVDCPSTKSSAIPFSVLCFFKAFFQTPGRFRFGICKIYANKPTFKKNLNTLEYELLRLHPK